MEQEGGEAHFFFFHPAQRKVRAHTPAKKPPLSSKEPLISTKEPYIPALLAIEKIGDWKKLEILVQNQSF